MALEKRVVKRPVFTLLRPRKVAVVTTRPQLRNDMNDDTTPARQYYMGKLGNAA
jgi:hypothetical protein